MKSELKIINEFDKKQYSNYEDIQFEKFSKKFHKNVSIL